MVWKTMIRLDTHVVVWLHARRISPFPEMVRKLLETEPLTISPAVYLEMQYLYEAGKIRFTAADIFSYLQQQIALSLSDITFGQVATTAAEFSWTRDPFDRLIVADAEASGATLLTRDREILEHYPKALWK